MWDQICFSRISTYKVAANFADQGRSLRSRSNEVMAEGQGSLWQFHVCLLMLVATKPSPSVCQGGRCARKRAWIVLWSGWRRLRTATLLPGWGGTSNADSEGKLQAKPDSWGAPLPRGRNIFISKENCSSGLSMWTQERGSHHSHASTSLPPPWVYCYGNFGCCSLAEQQSVQVWTLSEVLNRNNIYWLRGVDLQFYS